MICRHSKGDPNCGSSGGSSRVEYIYRDKECTKPHLSAGDVVITPDSKNYEIQQFEQVGPHAVVKILYPNCKKCAYEGNKVCVFLNVTSLQALKWREIDPHFRAPKERDPKKAPSPAARFPASEEGWRDALAYARGKVESSGVRSSEDY